MKNQEYKNKMKDVVDMRNFLLDTPTHESDEFIQDLEYEGLALLIEKYYIGGIESFLGNEHLEEYCFNRFIVM